MANMELLYKALDTAIWELGEGFKGMPDEDLWKRPAPQLLSVGELGAHVAYGLMQWLGRGHVDSPLFIESTRYYPYNVREPFEVKTSAADMYEEIKRVHATVIERIKALNVDSEDQSDSRTEFNWGQSVTYQIFHVGYHTGQIYSVRHLLGHEPADN